MPTTLEDYLHIGYPFEVIPAEEGGVVIRYPDLPGCVTQVEDGEDIAAAAAEILEGWLAVAIEDGDAIPLPVSHRAHSGRFVLRLPRSLHADLAREAEREGVSLNTWTTTILASRRGHPASTTGR